MYCFRTGVEKGMKLCTAMQEGCGYKDTLRVHRYFAPLAKYFTVCVTYLPVYVAVPLIVFHFIVDLINCMHQLIHNVASNKCVMAACCLNSCFSWPIIV
jgi:hypothetical protein